MSEEPVDVGGRWTYAGVVHDLSRWPLVVIILPASGTDEGWARLLERMELCFDDQWRKDNGLLGRSCALMDISRVTDNNAIRRKQWDELLARNEEVFFRDTIANALVITSTLGRFIYTALTWLEAARGAKRPPHTVFGTYLEAEAWVIEKLAEAGLSPGGTKPQRPAPRDVSGEFAPFRD